MRPFGQPTDLGYHCTSCLLPGSRVSGRDCSSSARPARGPLTRVARRRSRRRAACATSAPRRARSRAGIRRASARACGARRAVVCRCRRASRAGAVRRRGRMVAPTTRHRRAAPVSHRARPARTGIAGRSRTRATRRTGPGSFRAAPRRRPAWPAVAASTRCRTLRARPHLRRNPPSTPPRPRLARRGKPVLPAKPSVARRAARARRRRVAKRCHRCAAVSHAARCLVACSSLSKPKAGGQTARARVDSAAPPRVSPAPLRRTGCDRLHRPSRARND